MSTLRVLSAPVTGSAGLVPAFEMRMLAPFFRSAYAGSTSQPTTTSYLPPPIVRRSCAKDVEGATRTPRIRAIDRSATNRDKRCIGFEPHLNLESGNASGPDR